MKRNGEGKARTIEREVIDLTLSSDEEEGDDAADKSENSRAVPMDVDAEGDANAKDSDFPKPPPLSLPLPWQHGNYQNAEYSDSHHAEIEIDGESTAKPAASPLQEPAFSSDSALTSAIAKTEPHDVPLSTSPPFSRPPLSRQHLRIVFKPHGGSVLCMTCR